MEKYTSSAYTLDRIIATKTQIIRTTTESGSTVEVAMVSNEGVVGLSTILKNRVIPTK